MVNVDGKDKEIVAHQTGLQGVCQRTRNVLIIVAFKSFLVRLGSKQLKFECVAGWENRRHKKGVVLSGIYRTRLGEARRERAQRLTFAFGDSELAQVLPRWGNRYKRCRIRDSKRLLGLWVL